MSKPELDQSYLDEWERQFGAKSSSAEDEVDPPDNSIEDSLVPEEHHQDPSSGDASEETVEKVENSEEHKQDNNRTKDDEYREFVNGQPSEELKEQARKIVQSLKTSDGRTSSLHRQLNAKDLLIQQLYNSGSRAKREHSVPTSPRQETAQAQPPELPDKVKALKQKNPAAAEIIEQIAKHHSDLTKKQMQELIDERFGTIEKDREVATRVQEWNRLEERAADLFSNDGLTAAEIVRSEDFHAWLAIKRVEEPGIYNLYTQAKDADTAFLILQKYDQEYKTAIASMGSGTQEGHIPKGDEIRSRRESTRQQASGVKPSRIASKPSDTSSLSYNEEWNLLWGPNGKYTKQRKRS